MLRRTRVLILGAGGRDFHNFNVFFRDNPNYEVVAFTATQIPGIVGKRYPPELAGNLYPEGIPILPESSMEDIIKRLGVDVVVLAYSDLTYSDVGERLSRALAAGASFLVLGPRDTMLESSKPVIAVTAVRTGAGKSTVSRAVVRELTKRGYRVAPIRHPMAYGDLAEMAVQKFERMEDLDKYNVTVEEREEYEHYLRMGLPVYAGVDYGKILALAEREADIILWDGGNNDWPFIRPDFMITVADALRPGQEISSFPGEVNVRMADAVIINKADQAAPEAVDTIKSNIKRVNPKAKISVAKSVVTVDNPDLIKGRRVLVLEDSPTVTHGGAPYAAGYVAAKKYGAKEIVDPRPYAVGIIKAMYEKYPHMAEVLPSTGYSGDQLRDLEETIRRTPADVVILGTPADITRLIRIDKPVVRVSYELEIVEGPTIDELIDE
ncbi:MAG: cyclic 2,3-diphosphoglycerate synthase, partial [Desulfurococcales archaeon]|nr:cyclic 2,3-diphosphoglycerate synthase [Desulfurococcales archaeon]